MKNEIKRRQRQTKIQVMIGILIVSLFLFLSPYSMAVNNETNTATKSSNANLKNLGIKPNDFTGFKANKTEYEITVDETVTDLQVYATTQDAKADLDGTGDYELSDGLNKILVTVTAEDGTEKVYTLNVTKKASQTAATTNTQNEVLPSNTTVGSTGIVSNYQEVEDSMKQMKNMGYIIIGLVGIISVLSILMMIYSYRVRKKDDEEEQEEIEEEIKIEKERSRRVEPEEQEEGMTVNILEDIYRKSREEKQEEVKEETAIVEPQKIEAIEEEKVVQQEIEQEEPSEEMVDRKKKIDELIQNHRDYNYERRIKGKDKGKHF